MPRLSPHVCWAHQWGPFQWLPTNHRFNITLNDSNMTSLASPSTASSIRFPQTETIKNFNYNHPTLQKPQSIDPSSEWAIERANTSSYTPSKQCSSSSSMTDSSSSSRLCRTLVWCLCRALLCRERWCPAVEFDDTFFFDSVAISLAIRDSRSRCCWKQQAKRNVLQVKRFKFATMNWLQFRHSWKGTKTFKRAYGGSRRIDRVQGQLLTWTLDSKGARYKCSIVVYCFWHKRA